MHLLFLVMTLFVFAGCASNDEENSRDPASLDVVVPEPDCGAMTEDACDAFDFVNQKRAENGVQALETLTNCVDAAQFHAEDMQANSYFSHDGLTETWQERMERFGITGLRGENIAISNSPAEVVESWMNSDGHRANILNANYKSAGMGQAGRYWVQCFSSAEPQE